MSGVNHGFTLIEAVVAASVFAIASTSIVGVYTSIQRLNQRSKAIQAIQQNVRFLNEDLTKLIANGSIDYVGYGGSVPQPSAVELRVIDKDGRPVRIYQSAGGSLMLQWIAPISRESNLTGNEVIVQKFRVFIYPPTSPWTATGLREQPTVTIYAELESNTGQRDKVRESFQITVATREYPEQ